MTAPPLSDAAPLRRSAGALAIASGLLLLAYWYGYVLFMPYRQLSTTLSLLALHPAWLPINALGVLGALAGLLSLPGIYQVQAAPLGPRGAAAFQLALAGSALLLAPMAWDSVLWRPLATHDPALLDFDGPIYGSAAFLPFFITAGMLWGLGHCAFGVLSARAAVLPRLPCLLLAAGAPLFAFGALAGGWQAPVRSVGITAFGLGMLLVGRALWRPGLSAAGRPL